MASTSMETPMTSESRINSCRLSSHICPVLVKNWIPCIHSASVRFTSRMKACRWVIRLLITSFKRALGACAMLFSTLRVICSSVLLLIGMLYLRWQARDGFNLDQQIVEGQFAHLDGCTGRRMLCIHVAVTHFPYDGQVCHIHEVVIQLDHVGEIGSHPCESRLKIFKDLLGLRTNIAFPNDTKCLVNRNLPRNVDSSSTRDFDDMRVTGRASHGRGIDKLEMNWMCCHALFLSFHKGMVTFVCDSQKGSRFACCPALVRISLNSNRITHRSFSHKVEFTLSPPVLQGKSAAVHCRFACLQVKRPAHREGVREPCSPSLCCLDIPAGALKVEENAGFIADDHGIVSWRGDGDIARPEIVYGAIVHHCAKMSRNDVGKMGTLATLCSCDGPHMLGPPPARLTDHSDNGHIAEFDDFHVGLWGRACFVWCIEALHL